jgi:hypothetical protein
VGLADSNPSSRQLAIQRGHAFDALVEYGLLLRVWNKPDDEHTEIQMRDLLEDVLGEVFQR